MASETPFFFLRTPVFPAAFFSRFLENDPRSESLSRRFISDPILKEALCLATPGLFARLSSEIQMGGDLRQFEDALLRYLSRMCFRPTPFGTFSGFSVGKISKDKTAYVELCSLDNYKKKCVVDASFYDALTRLITEEAQLLGTLKVVSNPTIFKNGVRFHYLEATLDGDLQKAEYASVERNQLLEKLIEFSKKPKTLKKLGRWIEERGATSEDAHRYLLDLLGNHILIATPTNFVTGSSAEESHQMLKLLQRFPRLFAYQEAFQEVLLGAAALNDTAPGARSEVLESYSTRVWPRGLPGNSLRVDLVKPSPNLLLPKTIADDCHKVVELLSSIYPQTDSHELRAFMEKFDRRYGDRTVPLLEALDPEVGAGFAHDTCGQDAAAYLPHERASLDFESFLFQRYYDCVSSGGEEVILTETDLKKYSIADPKPLPDSFSVMTSLSARSPEALRDGNYLITFKSMASSPSTALLGRFCASSSELMAYVDQIHESDAALSPEAIVAEIIFHAHGRVANALRRPVFSTYEIPILSRPEVSSNFQICPSDLLISVKGGQIVLTSKRLQKRVIPRSTTAHNFASSNMPLYRFLCHLQNAGQLSSLSWRWFSIGQSPFVPRVRLGRVILSLATWRLKGADFKELANKRIPLANRKELFSNLSKRWKIPENFSVVQGDQVLPVFSANSMSLGGFFSSIKQNEALVLKELDPAWVESPFYGPEGSFTNEIIIPFVRKQNTPRLDASGSPDRRKKHAVNSHRSTKWLSLRIYGGKHTLEHLLTQTLEPYLTKWSDQRKIRKYFFVRYCDPDTHLRLRFEGKDSALNEILKVFTSKIELTPAGGALWKFEIGSYFPETVRYGGEALIEFAERVFFADSQAILAAIRLIRDTPFEVESRWKIGVLNILSWLDCFGLSRTEALTFCIARRKALRSEVSRLKNTPSGGPSLNLNAREFMYEYFGAGRMGQTVQASVEAVFRKRNRTIGRRKIYLKRLALHPNRDAILHSHIHMSLNRLFMDHQHVSELELLDLAFRVLIRDASGVSSQSKSP